MEHFQSEERRKTENEQHITPVQERRQAFKSVSQELFFEYDMSRDTICFSRDSALTALEGKSISNFTEKISRLERICEDDLDGFFSFLRQGDKETCEFRYVKEDGSYMWCLARGACIRGEEGSSQILVGTITDIDQEKRMHEMLIEQALLDPLTKLYSKGKAQGMIESFLRNEGSFGKHALMIVNIKGFHEINRRYGTVFGDSVLVTVGELLQKGFRKKDLLSRVGGDDFLILIKDIVSTEAVTRKIKQVIGLIEGIYAGENVEVACNIGVACFPQDGRNFGTLFRNADCALYKASKQAGSGYELFDASDKLDEYNKRGEFYHEYIINERGGQGCSNFSQEITDYAIDIMLNSKDVASAVKILLDKVGKYYKCDNVAILETDDNEILHTTYSWSSRDGLNHFNAMQFIDLKEMPSMADYFDERGLRIFSNTSIMRRHPGYAPLMNMLNAKALLQCAFYDDGVFKGCVCVSHEKKTHEWTKEEVDTLLTITKLLSIYLLKLRASEKIQNRIAHLKNYDVLTNLPTQHKFMSDVEAELNQNRNCSYAIVYMDINKFKYINDTLGYEAGDDLLREISRTVSAGMYDIVLMGRISADNFVLLMTYVSQEQIVDNLRRLNDSFLSKIKICSVGKSTYLVCGVSRVKYGQDVMAAIDNANVARKLAKKQPQFSCCFYDDKMEQQILLEMDICNSMQRALEDGEFLMYLQPKVSLHTKGIVGAEALTRWKRKDGKLMAPDQFIPLFEKNGFIINLDFHIYECACKTIRNWMDEKITPVPVSVNVSRVHLNNDNFTSKVISLVDQYKVPHQYLEFELTESIFLDNTETAINTMRQLREAGFFVSIDDFGAGFSSLNLLKDMTTDVLKLDKEFFGKGDMKNEEKIIVSNITNMAKQLKMKVLSEGVETEAQSAFLEEISCDMAQGYLFAKPMPEKEFTQLLRNQMSFGLEK